MAEYISRDDLLNAINSNVAEAHNERCSQLLEAILNAPTADVVEVVRCKDCTFRQPIDESRYTFKGKPAMVCILHSKAVAEDGYCSYGKRRDT